MSLSVWTLWTLSCLPYFLLCEGCYLPNGQACAQWGEWMAWSACSKPCDGGQQSRQRQCSQYIGCEGPRQESQSCNQQPCCASWSDWTACSVTCGQGTQTCNRRCSVGGQNNYQSNVESKTQNCQGYMPVCATWGDWGEWCTCTQTCNGGTRERSRHCSVYGNVCPGDATQREPCGMEPCAYWKQWDDWTPCAVTCGGGQRTRRRQCTVENGCFGDSDTKETCNQQRCPTWQDWAAWGTCSKDCGGGQRNRSRKCSVDDALCAGDSAASNNQCKCLGGSGSESGDCNTFQCPLWAEWGIWSECSKTCGTGAKDRKRTCNRASDYCTADKLQESVCKCSGGNDVENTDCNTDACPVWLEWGEWSPCDVTCSTGKQVRKRDCSRTDAPCEGGSAEEVKECALGECPQWSSWTTWSECTTVCGGGSQTRARQCPIPDGCDGLSNDTAICNMIPCSEWGLWGPWSSCSLSCGGGQRVRTRTCPVEGKCIPGQSYEVDPEKCNPQVCPSWMQWASWGSCSVTCGQGQQTRTRACDPAPGCIGSMEEFQACFDTPCPSAVFWSEWSPCTKTCAGGQKVRSRFTCPDPAQCPKTEVENTACSEEACPEWTQWEEWTGCSKTCGKGARTRKRTCPVVNGCVGEALQSDPTPCNDIPCPVG